LNLPRDPLRHPGHVRLFANSVFVALGQGSVALLFVVYILAARILGNAGFGDFSLGTTIALVLLALPAWGTVRYASILAARDPERTEDILSPSVGLTAVLALVYLPLVWVTATLVRDSDVVTRVAVLIGVDLLAREYGNLMRYLMRVHGAFALDTVSVFAERGLMVAGAAFVLLVEPDPVLLAAAFAAGRTLGVSITGALYRARVGPIGMRVDPPSLRRLFSGGTPIAIRRGLADISFRIDMLFLGALRPSTELGWYGSIYQLMDGVVMLPSLVTESLSPTLSANFAEGRLDVVQRLYERGAKYLLLGGLFLSAVFAVLAEPIVQLLFGAAYAPAADALRLLSPAVLFIFLRRQATSVLDNVDLRSSTVWAFAGGVATNIVLNSLLVPSYGYLGAATATSVSEALLMGSMIWILSQAGYKPVAVTLIRAALLSIGLATLVMWTLVGVPVLAFLAAAAVYLVSLTALRVWDEKDMLLLRDLRRRRAGGDRGAAQ